MLLEGLKEKARLEARDLEAVDDLPAAEERLRADLTAFWARVPEPPAYRRKDEPLKARAEVLLEDAVPLLARGEQLKASTAMQPYLLAFSAHLEMLALLTEGKVEAADEHWRRALKLEREAARANRLWESSEETADAVYDRSTGSSRYDPQPETTYAVRLLCANCRAPGDFRFSPRHAHHRFVCGSCKSTFSAYVAELRTLEAERVKQVHRYRFRVEELSGNQTRIEFDDAGTAELGVARRDLLAFLYNRDNELKAVLNLTSSRVLWTTPPGGCFLATAVYGEGATELEDFRAFRDRVLLPSAGGRALVRGYYAVGPGLARAVKTSPVATFALKRALEALRPHLGGRR
jgi:hypothetical protein